MRKPRSVREADVAGKVVLVRADLNVPLEDGRVADDTRIRASLPTLELLLDGGAAEVRVASHFGRPKTEEDRVKYAMAPVAARLRELLPDDRVKVLENTRFEPGETSNDEEFARRLADGSDLYVNDAFGSAHRAHASTEAIAHLLPAYAGLLLLDELEHLGRLLGDVDRPFVLISGGAKVEDKLGVLRNLGGRADTVLIGGKMAEELRTGNPLDFSVELPVDVVGAAEFAADAECRVCGYDELPDGWLGLDIGPETRTSFAEKLAGARTIFWNGPMGVFEWPRFADGTKAVAEAVAGNADAFSVVGGADSVRALNELGLADESLVGLDRRRREPRAARGKGAARRGSDPVVIVAGNWKMFRGPDPEALAGLDAIVCPPYTRLADCVAAGLTTYAQNVHWEPEGAFTGEISAPMLLELGAAGSLVGHSERRQLFGETDEGVARRAEAALAAGLGVIACVGETLEQREADETEDVLRRQVTALPQDDRLVIAYEPVWAIGTGLTATPEMAQDAHSFIKSLLDVPVLYGGSVKPDNAAGLFAQPDVDGALVGGASLDVHSFRAICDVASKQ